MQNPPKVSVVIAAYRPGEAFARVIDSLDAQTLPQEAFETIVVDDGSPDDTFAELTALAATRPNLRIERIENSGWASRPRNIGTAMARGDYVFYMDHDDSLYPDALRRMVEYADETRADVLSPKESKTVEAWWGMPALADGNLPNALADGGIDRLVPMVPHKLYRRGFLLEHGIVFPEGRRQLWEDVTFNVEAWRHADRVAVLADTPVYLWHSSATNNSKTYGPLSEEFWDRLDDLFVGIDAALVGEELESARRAALVHQYVSRLLLRLSRNLRRATPEEAAMAMRRARAIQDRYVPEEWDARLGRQVRARAILLRQDRPDLLATLWQLDVDTACVVTATEARWEDGRLRLRLEAHWRTKRGDPVALVRVGDRLQRDLPPELRAALPEDVLDFTDTLPEFQLQLGLRDRRAKVTWQLALDQRAAWTELPGDRVVPALVGEALVDPADVAFGRPLEPSVHDFVASLRWDGAHRTGPVRYDGRSAPAVLPTGTAVLYSSQRGTLALDGSATLRTVIADGLGPAGSRSSGDLQLALPRVQVFAPVLIPAAARLCAVRGNAEHVVAGGLVASGSDARLDLESLRTFRAGRYELSLALADGPFLSARPVRLKDGVLTLRAVDAPWGPVRRVIGILRRVRNRLRRR